MNGRHDKRVRIVLRGPRVLRSCQPVVSALIFIIETHKSHLTRNWKFIVQTGSRSPGSWRTALPDDGIAADNQISRGILRESRAVVPNRRFERQRFAKSDICL